MQYRREIDGLRGLAVLSVIFFHANSDLVSGGFVGVDIFFVISGYLITTIILEEINKGDFSLIGFYERRARRILPALFFVLLVCLPLAWVFMLPDDLNNFAESLIYVSLFLSNVFFYKGSGYFDAVDESKPLLHTWSLAVEEQYYLIFPLMMVFLWRFGARYIFIALLFLFGASFVYADLMSVRNPPLAFYLLQTRFWELLIGSLVAVYLEFFQRGEIFQKEIPSIIGLIFISTAIFLFDGNIPYPSLYTLVPTVGAAFIILFSGQRNFVGKVLSSETLVGIGLISYSLYLWHQPLFSFSHHYFLLRPSLFGIIGLITFVFLISYFTWRFVEKPFRNKKWINRRSIFIFSIIGICFFILSGFFYKDNKFFQNQSMVYSGILKQFEKHNLISQCDIKYDLKKESGRFCVLGDINDVHPEAVVLGDSHAEAMLPAFDKAFKDIKKSFVYIGLGGCPPIVGVYVLKSNYTSGVCENLAKRQLDYVKKNHIKKVFLVAMWSLYTDGNYIGKGMYYLGLERNDKRDKNISRQAFVQGFDLTVQSYSDLGVKVFVASQTPRQIYDAKTVYNQAYTLGNLTEKTDIIKRFSVSAEKHQQLKSFTEEIFSNRLKHHQIVLMNFDDILCSSDVCMIGIAGLPYYRDPTHLSTGAAYMLVDRLKAYIH